MIKGRPSGKICKKCFIEKVVADRKERVKKGWKRKENRKCENCSINNSCEKSKKTVCENWTYKSNNNKKT